MTKGLTKFMLIAVLTVMVLLVTSCAVDTSYSGSMNVVEASKVIEDMASNPAVIVIDARGKEAYDKGHLEGAICLSVEEAV
ncbi:MAG TPA: rhodanese-like domain-containing protein, partial [Fusibacter sp.]|nr:rhodanese-like domain-containing protein [Fusibacter sp.]